MFNLITHDLGEDAIVIDADDQMTDPKGMLMEYCTFTGLQYDDRMLDWKNDKDKPDKPWEFIPDTWTCDVKGTTDSGHVMLRRIKGLNIHPSLVALLMNACIGTNNCITTESDHVVF